MLCHNQLRDQYAAMTLTALACCLAPHTPDPFAHTLRSLLTKIDGLLQRHHQPQLLVEAAGALVYASSQGPEALQVSGAWGSEWLHTINPTKTTLRKASSAFPYACL